MKKELYPHLEAGMLLDVERRLRMQRERGFGTRDFCRSARMSVRTLRKWRTVAK